MSIPDIRAEFPHFGSGISLVNDELIEVKTIFT